MYSRIIKILESIIGSRMFSLPRKRNACIYHKHEMVKSRLWIQNHQLLSASIGRKLFREFLALHALARRKNLSKCSWQNPLENCFHRRVIRIFIDDKPRTWQHFQIVLSQQDSDSLHAWISRIYSFERWGWGSQQFCNVNKYLRLKR